MDGTKIKWEESCSQYVCVGITIPLGNNENTE